MDSSLANQQNLAQLQLAVIVLRAISNRLQDTSPLMPQVLASLSTLQPGDLVEIT